MTTTKTQKATPKRTFKPVPSITGHKGFTVEQGGDIFYISKNGVLYGTAETQEQCVAQIDFYYSLD